MAAIQYVTFRNHLVGISDNLKIQNLSSPSSQVHKKEANLLNQTRIQSKG